MIGNEFVELREFGNDVFGGVPIQTGVAVNADFFRRQPFHAAGETEAAARTAQRAKTVAQQGPFFIRRRGVAATVRGEAGVVVRFGIVDVAADALVLAVGVIEIPRDFAAGIILE